MMSPLVHCAGLVMAIMFMHMNAVMEPTYSDKDLKIDATLKTEEEDGNTLFPWNRHPGIFSWYSRHSEADDDWKQVGNMTTIDPRNQMITNLVFLPHQESRDELDYILVGKVRIRKTPSQPGPSRIAPLSFDCKYLVKSSIYNFPFLDGDGSITGSEPVVGPSVRKVRRLDAK